MPNTFKKSTFFYIAAAIFAPFVILRPLLSFGFGLSLIHLWIITIPVFGFLAYRSFRKGSLLKATAEGAVPGAAPPARGSSRLYIGVAIAVLAVIAIGYGVRSGRLFVAGVSKPPLVGAYRDDRGGKIEFLASGTALAASGNDTVSVRWSLLDDTRLRLEPEQVGFLGQICEYKFRSYSALSIANCDFRMNLTRM